MTNEYTMEDLINESLYGLKQKPKKNKVQVKESQVNVKKILGEEEEKEKEREEKPKKEKDQKKSGEEASTLDASDATAKGSKEKTKKKEAKGDLVMTVSLSISDTDQGKIEVGSEEYASITNVSSLLSLYDINTKNLIDPEKTTETLTLTVQEELSKSEKNNVAMMMRSNIDGTISINVLVNELGQPFDNINNAINYFNTQYQNNILNIINKEIRA